MFVISDFPPYVIDQIVGVQDTSYVVTKLWLCGNMKLNDKLSKGLTFLDLRCHALGSDGADPIPAQSLIHLPLLKDLCIDSIPVMPSSILKTLPRSLTHLQIDTTGWNEDDLPYLPPHLHSCYLENITPKVVDCMSLRSIACLDQKEVSSDVWELAQNRVLQASQNQ